MIMRYWKPIIISILLLGAIALVGLSRHTTETVTASSRWPTPANAGPVTNPTGIKAIAPKGLTGSSTPAFSVQDVQDYVATHQTLETDPAKPSPVITSIQFLTGEQVNQQLGFTTGQSENSLLCLVMMKGYFINSSPLQPTAHTNRTGFLIFDAHTGNLMGEGQQP